MLLQSDPVISASRLLVTGQVSTKEKFALLKIAINFVGPQPVLALQDDLIRQVPGR